MNLNEALSSAKDMFTIPDEVMGNIQKAFDSIQEKAYVHMEDISQLQEYFPRIIEYILKARFEDAKDIYGLQAIASQEFVALFVSFVMSERISTLTTDVATMNKIAANLQSSRGKVLMYLEDLETKISDFKMWLQDKVDDGAENYDKDEAFKEALEQLNKTLGGEDARSLDN